MNAPAKPIPLPTPSEVLDEQLSDKLLSRTADPTKLAAVLACAAVAIPTMMRAAAAGNIQCKAGMEAIAPFLCLLKK